MESRRESTDVLIIGAGLAGAATAARVSPARRRRRGSRRRGDGSSPAPCDDRLAGFARVISNRATFAYLGDVFIDEPLRGQGLSKWLVATILDHPDLQGLRRWLLVTRGAHDLYRRFGFADLKHPAIYLEIVNPNVYQQPRD